MGEAFLDRYTGPYEYAYVPVSNDYSYFSIPAFSGGSSGSVSIGNLPVYTISAQEFIGSIRHSAAKLVSVVVELRLAIDMGVITYVPKYGKFDSEQVERTRFICGVYNNLSGNQSSIFVVRYSDSTSLFSIRFKSVDNTLYIDLLRSGSSYTSLSNAIHILGLVCAYERSYSTSL